MSDHWVCIGHSHVGAIAGCGAPNLDVIDFWVAGPLWDDTDEGIRFRPDIVERVAKGSQVLSMIGGFAHYILGAAEHPRPFDFVLPSRPDLPFDDSRLLVPADAVRAKLTEMGGPQIDPLSELVRISNGPVVHIAPPPPAVDIQIVEYPVDPFEGRRVVAPKWVRYKIWRLHCEIIEAHCNQNGIRFLPPPAAATDDDGFLLPEYRLSDFLHGNAGYGALVLEQLGRVW